MNLKEVTKKIKIDEIAKLIQYLDLLADAHRAGLNAQGPGDQPSPGQTVLKVNSSGCTDHLSLYSILKKYDIPKLKHPLITEDIILVENKPESYIRAYQKVLNTAGLTYSVSTASIVMLEWNAVNFGNG